MKTYLRLILAAVAVAGLLSVQGTSAAQSTNRPNLLFICVDELHPAIAGFRGNPVVKTPALDALAAGGTHFTRTYVSCPVCGPSRASYMFGKYIFQLKNWYNGTPWPKDEVTWARRMTDSGYYTAHFGKMDSPELYGTLGFTEEWHSTKRPERMSQGYTNFLKARGAKGHLKVSTFEISDYKTDPYQTGPTKFGHYSVDFPTVNHALKFLETRKGGKQPWMLHVGFLMPHWPFTLPQKYYDLYANADMPMPHDARFPNPDMHPALQYFQKWDGLDVPPDPEEFKKALKGYYGLVTCVDDMVGELIAKLKKDGMYENTYIVFTSDHGDNLGEHGLMGNKHTPMEGSVAVPLVITGPGVKHGATVNTPVALVDMYPTIMSMAGISSHDPAMPGKDLLPVLQGKEAAADRTVFSEWHGDGFPSAWYMLANKKYKYIYYEGYRPSLFDMEADPKEIHDLALDPAHAETVKMFEATLKGMLDPVKVAKLARQEEGLFSADGRDLLLENGGKIGANGTKKVKK